MGVQAGRITARGLFLGTAMLLLAACKGADGPMGPAGPQGPQGAQGPAGPQGPAASGGTSQYTVSGSIPSSGQIVIQLPTSVGTPSNLPTLTCYISTDQQTWLTVTSGGNAACGLNTASSPLKVILIGATGFQYYYVSVVYH